MPKRSRKAKPKKRNVIDYTPPSRDANKAAFNTVQQLIALSDKGELTSDGKDPLAVALGRRGGLKGGQARAANMTASERRKSASHAAKARWGKKREV